MRRRKAREMNARKKEGKEEHDEREDPPAEARMDTTANEKMAEEIKSSDKFIQLFIIISNRFGTYHDFARACWLD